jgi:hypothetical protein
MIPSLRHFDGKLNMHWDIRDFGDLDYMGHVVLEYYLSR